ncbi:MAG: VWA domain-containing protein [Lewinellaceae bacterium]|nr:VWA domain-containing protein [Lewinellaceae bacterium]
MNGSPECNTFENYSLTATAGGLSSSAPIRGCRVPTPANFALDIELVIDVSGSMFEDAICACIQPSRAGSECIAETTNLNKLEYLKGKLAQFYQDIKPAMDNNTKNRLGLVVFSENAREEIPLTYFDVAGVSLLDAQIAAKMGSGGLQPETSTAMGKGLDLAIQKLDATPPGGEYNRHKVILLMTNGMQNEDPEVKKLPNGNVIIDKATPVVLNGAGIKIIPYAIFTPEGEYLDLLKSLGQAAGVTDVGLSTAPYVCRVTPDIESGWVSSLESMDSPKQIVHKNGRLNGMNGQETFNIQEGMDMLTIRIGSMGAGNYHAFKVEKLDGGVWKDITGFGDVIPQLSGGSSPFRVYNVSFPILKPGAPAVMEGEYRVTFSADRADWVYEMSVIVDDKGLKQDFFVTPFIRAGEPMLLGTRLRQSGNPVVDAKVKAILYQPKKRLSNSFAAKRYPANSSTSKAPGGNFLSLKGIRPATHGSNDVSSSGGAYMDLKSWEGGYIKQISIDDPGLKSFQREGAKMENGEKKYLVLLHETNFREVYEQDIIAEIPLTHVGDGVYRAQYAGTQKAGLYHVRMEAEGNHPTIGAYRRFEEKTPVVIFGTPTEKNPACSCCTNRRSC